MFGFLKSNSQKSPSRHSQSDLLTGQERLRFLDRPVDVRRIAYKRTISLTLKVNGHVVVSAPKSTSLKRIEDFLLANREWIKINLSRCDELQKRYPRKRYSEGEKFLFLGNELRLFFEPHSKTRASALIDEDRIVVRIPSVQWEIFRSQDSHPELAPLIADLFAQAGKRILAERIQVHSGRMGLHPTAVSFRSQKTRWGSCSARGKISLNWRLIVAPLDVIDYVVVHELAHLRHHNHSRHFWTLVSEYHPHLDRSRDWLKNHQYEADFLASRSELHG